MLDVVERFRGGSARRQPVGAPMIDVRAYGAEALHILPILSPRVLEPADADAVDRRAVLVEDGGIAVVVAEAEGVARLDVLLDSEFIRALALRAVQPHAPHEGAVGGLAVLAVAPAVLAHHVEEEVVAEVEVGEAVVLGARLGEVEELVDGLPARGHDAGEGAEGAADGGALELADDLLGDDVAAGEGDEAEPQALDGSGADGDGLHAAVGLGDNLHEVAVGEGGADGAVFVEDGVALGGEAVVVAVEDAVVAGCVHDDAHGGLFPQLAHSHIPADIDAGRFAACAGLVHVDVEGEAFEDFLVVLVEGVAEVCEGDLSHRSAEVAEEAVAVRH